MARQSIKILLYIVTTLALLGCSASKFIPEGKYMLDEARIHSDNKNVRPNQLSPYIRQRGNSKWFSMLKIPLGTYALAGKDSTKWINRKLKDMGEGPVVFDSIQAFLTCEDLSEILHGMGYVRAYVDFKVVPKKKNKVNIIYNLHSGPTYRVKEIRYDIQDAGIDSTLQRLSPDKSYIYPGMVFNVNALDDERKRITSFLNDNGYYRFHKDFITFQADTIEGSTFIDLELEIHKFYSGEEEVPHTRYTIESIVYSDKATGGKLPLRKSVLEESTIIEAGKPFSSSDLQKTYDRFSRLSIIKYTNIKFTEIPGEDELSCDIDLSAGKLNSISLQPEGTNTSGDLGAALSLTYENKNIFRGAETFSIKLRGAFEAITGLEGYQNRDYEEYLIESTLTFPRFIIPFLSKNFRHRSTAVSEVTASYNLQNRPEFHRRVFGAAWRYRWSNASKKKNFKIDLIDLNYIYMPWISPTFKNDYLDDNSSRNSILKYNYEDLFIMRLGFGLSFTNGLSAYKINLESAGNLLDGIAHALGTRVNDDGQRTLFNIAFAQYVKGDFDFTHLFRLSKRDDLAFHFGVGIAYPYGNSKVLPFEKRYFSGGANSVRGWSVRGLGPGKFKGTDGSIDFINQTGDVKLDINLEYRPFLFWKFFGALFIDAGNIWTLRSYQEQPEGQFKISEFYKQIALAYGIGIRLNFDYFVLRFDMGMKAINPAYDTNDEHYAIVHPDFSRDFSFHFAVGLPF